MYSSWLYTSYPNTVKSRQISNILTRRFLSKCKFDFARNHSKSPKKKDKNIELEIFKCKTTGDDMVKARAWNCIFWSYVPLKVKIAIRECSSKTHVLAHMWLVPKFYDLTYLFMSEVRKSFVMKTDGIWVM